MRCNFENCYQKVVLIVGTCRYCENSYCLKHRLPEGHYCKNMNDCKDKAKENLKTTWKPKKINEGAYSRGEGGGCRS